MNGVGLHMTRAFAPQAAPTRRSSLSKMPNGGVDRPTMAGKETGQ